MTLRCRDLDGVSRFADRAEAYALARPSYPDAALGFILRSVQDNGGAIVDIGAGTAISTRLLAARRARVTGVDPGLDMLSAARANEMPAVVAGRAERLPFRAASAQLLTAFNSFHWFQPDEFFAEAHRVLVPSGRLALVWNEWNHDDAFTSEFVALMRSCAGDHPPENLEAEVAPLYETRLFEHFERASFEIVHVLDYDRLRLRLRSMSYVPLTGPVWDTLAERLALLFTRHADGNGLVRHHYTTAVFAAARRNDLPETL